MFLTDFYRSGYKVGVAFVKALIPVTLLMIVCEALPHFPTLGWLDDLDGATQLRLLPVLESLSDWAEAEMGSGEGELPE